MTDLVFADVRFTHPFTGTGERSGMTETWQVGDEVAPMPLDPDHHITDPRSPDAVFITEVMDSGECGDWYRIPGHVLEILRVEGEER